jgi:hypothetical protein
VCEVGGGSTDDDVVLRWSYIVVDCLTGHRQGDHGSHVKSTMAWDMVSLWGYHRQAKCVGVDGLSSLLAIIAELLQ